MTKAECVLPDLGFKRVPERDMQDKKHDGSSFTIRVWKALINGHFWTIHCDSYYGRSIVFCDEMNYGDYEYRYKRLAGLVAHNSRYSP